MESASFITVFILLAGVISSPIAAQDNHNVVSGIVIDSQSGEALFGATIVDLDNMSGVSTDRYGRFSMIVRADSVQIYASYLGYQTVSIIIPLPLDSALVIALESTSLELPEVSITGDRALRTTTGTFHHITTQDINRVPALAGESDIVKVAQLMPGVHGGREGAAGLHVRGGSPDQNLMLLDGMTIYNVNHLIGFLSAFNPDVVRAVEFTKGPGSARHGGRLSSVFNVALKEGNRHDTQVTANVGSLASRVMVEGPIRTGRSSYLISARRTYFDQFWRLIQPENDKAGYYFYDVVAKASTVSDRSGLYMSLYAGRDRFWTRTRETLPGGSDESRTQLYWGNLTGVVRWQGHIGDGILASAGLGRSAYGITFGDESRAEFDGEAERRSLGYNSAVRDWRVHLDVAIPIRSSHLLSVGTSVVNHYFDPSRTSSLSSSGHSQQHSPIHAAEFAFYAENDINIGRNARASAGIRATSYLVHSKVFVGLEPRLSLRTGITPRTSVDWSFGVSKQHVHLLSRSSVGIPLDLWLPATPGVPPQSAVHAAIGSSHRSAAAPLEFGIEIYWKEMRNLVEPLDGGFLIGAMAANWEERVAAHGRGRSYGIELLVRKSEGRLSGWAAYTLSRSSRRFPSIDGGEGFPYRFDRLHDLSITGSYLLTSRWEAQTTFALASGNAIWLPEARAPYVENRPGFPIQPAPGLILSTYEYGPRNRSREPAYHRLDLSFRHQKETSWGRRTWTIGAYNVYARRNPFFIYATTDEAGRIEYRRVSPFILIPAVSLGLKW